MCEDPKNSGALKSTNGRRTASCVLLLKRRMIQLNIIRIKSHGIFMILRSTYISGL
uniref:Uncharacterized protein n=1 Tax=uncultured Desulfobacterium sp. TaxID=201089 RepID=E1YHB0_9BACT|nr:unknown protein [uncultured Desulfobacterium sp.]